MFGIQDKRLHLQGGVDKMDDPKLTNKVFRSIYIVFSIKLRNHKCWALFFSAQHSLYLQSWSMHSWIHFQNPRSESTYRLPLSLVWGFCHGDAIAIRGVGFNIWFVCLYIFKGFVFIFIASFNFPCKVSLLYSLSLPVLDGRGVNDIYHLSSVWHSPNSWQQSIQTLEGKGSMESLVNLCLSLHSSWNHPCC